jgi:LPS-assembly protein
LRTKFVWWTALPLLLTVPAAASAQTPAPLPAPAAITPPDQIIEFSADSVAYDSEAETVTASGDVRMNRDGNYLAANQVIWERKTGQVFARGNVVMLTPQGDKLVGENVQLTDTMRDGTIDNLMVVLASGGRIAARRGSRTNGVLSLTDAIYSP